MKQHPLTTFRDDNRLSLREAAQALGIRHGHYARLERGEASPTIDTLDAMAERSQKYPFSFSRSDWPKKDDEGC